MLSKNEKAGVARTQSLEEEAVLSYLKCPDGDESDPDARHAEDHREEYIEEGSAEVSLLQKQKRLKTEGREGGVSSEYADHQESAGGRGEDQFARI